MWAEFTFIDWLGVLGSVIIAGAYLAVSRAWVDATRPGFNFLNLFGALLVLLSLYYRPNAGAIIIEILWILIAIAALFRWGLDRRP